MRVSLPCYRGTTVLLDNGFCSFPLEVEVAHDGEWQVVLSDFFWIGLNVFLFIMGKKSSHISHLTLHAWSSLTWQYIADDAAHLLFASILPLGHHHRLPPWHSLLCIDGPILRRKLDAIMLRIGPRGPPRAAHLAGFMSACGRRVGVQASVWGTPLPSAEELPCLVNKLYVARGTGNLWSMGELDGSVVVQGMGNPLTATAVVLGDGLPRVGKAERVVFPTQHAGSVCRQWHWAPPGSRRLSRASIRVIGDWRPINCASLDSCPLRPLQSMTSMSSHCVQWTRLPRCLQFFIACLLLGGGWMWSAPR